MGKRHKPEENIGKLREAEIVLAQGYGRSSERRIGPSKLLCGGQAPAIGR